MKRLPVAGHLCSWSSLVHGIVAAVEILGICRCDVVWRRIWPHGAKVGEGTRQVDATKHGRSYYAVESELE